jgi:hypothetical protein
MNVRFYSKGIHAHLPFSLGKGNDAVNTSARKTVRQPFPQQGR